MTSPIEVCGMYQNLKLQLWKAGMRQNRLAQLAGIDETLLSRIVNGFREPDAAIRFRISRILSCDEDWLFERDPELPAADKRQANVE